MYKPIDSYSQSNFELINKNKSVYLKKFFNNFNKRDLLSLIKQDSFKDYKIDKICITTPKIEKDQLKKIDINKSIMMNYYNGVSGSQTLIQSDNETCKILSIFLSDYINKSLKKAEWHYIDSNILIKKVKNTLGKIKINELTILGNKILNILKKRLDKSMLWSGNYCHGDLTLGNIILNKKEKEIVLIDFLKTYNDGIIQDLSKLTQEFYLGWSARHLKEVNKLRANIIYETIWNKVNIFKIDKEINNIIFNETLVTLLRIFPYVNKNDTITIKWAQNSFYNMINQKFVFFK